MFHLEQDICEDTTSEPNGGDASPDLLARDAATGRATGTPSDGMPLVGYIEVPVKDIVGYLSAADDDEVTAGQGVIWIRRNAMLVWHKSERVPSHDRPGSIIAELKWPR